MAIIYKTPIEIGKIKHAGEILTKTQEILKAHIAEGISLKELDTIAYNFITSHFDTIPSFLNYHGFPATICASVNDTLIHGIPTNYLLKLGDLLSIDLGVCYQGYHADAAFSVIVGGSSYNENGQKLINTANEALVAAIKKIKPGVLLSEISLTIYKIITNAGFFTTKEYAGHGVGRHLHEEPLILNYLEPNIADISLQENMVIAIEPMIIEKTSKTFIVSDGWTVKSIDQSLCAHAENTIWITNDGCIVLA